MAIQFQHLVIPPDLLEFVSSVILDTGDFDTVGSYGVSPIPKKIPYQLCKGFYHSPQIQYEKVNSFQFFAPLLCRKWLSGGQCTIKILSVLPLVAQLFVSDIS